MLRDPNWLYSTIAQSTAALVAIIGGFLVSRVVSLAGTREALQRRCRELESRLAGVEPRLEDVKQRRFEWDADDFLNDAKDTLLELADQIQERGLTAGHLVSTGVDDQGRDPSEFDAMIAEVIARIADAQDAVAGLPSTEWPWTADEMRARGLTVRQEDEWIWEGLLARRNRDPHRPGVALGLRLDPTLSRSISGIQIPPAPGHSYADLRAREEELAATCAALRAEVALVRHDLEQIAATDDLVVALKILGGFAAVGLVLPVSLLALDPVPTSALARLFVVLTFTGGLVMLITYSWPRLVDCEPPVRSERSVDRWRRSLGTESVGASGAGRSADEQRRGRH